MTQHHINPPKYLRKQKKNNSVIRESSTGHRWHEEWTLQPDRRRVLNRGPTLCLLLPRALAIYCRTGLIIPQKPMCLAYLDQGLVS